MPCTSIHCVSIGVMFAASGALSGMKYSVYVRYTFWGEATRSWIMWFRTQVWPVV